MLTREGGAFSILRLFCLELCEAQVTVPHEDFMVNSL